MPKRYRVEDLQSAVSSVKQKRLTITQASTEFQVPRKTVEDHVKGKAKEAFRKTGIHPRNPDTIDKTRLVNSHLKTVICQPLPSSVPVKPFVRRPKLVLHPGVLTCDDLYRKFEEKATENKKKQELKEGCRRD
ncbi:hypothetical protein ACJMK2_011535 [Sinanodonta woodiana]|uniref:HTH psq-type domain-containing protein n=1 Tax=Sinanodonta woodiana TaxID=1069815 RepID=A0ABD3V5C6_SINWO